MARLDDRLNGLATLSPAQLRAAWAEVSGGPPPMLPTELLRRALAQRLQEKKHGTLPALVARELTRMGAGAAPQAQSRPRAVIRPGARLIRAWQGRTIMVEVVADGFLWEGELYASLSRIAKAVTGAHWSGPRFFGVSARG